LISLLFSLLCRYLSVHSRHLATMCSHKLCFRCRSCTQCLVTKGV
jgi:hypothetical protein